MAESGGRYAPLHKHTRARPQSADAHVKRAAKDARATRRSEGERGSVRRRIERGAKQRLSWARGNDTNLVRSSPGTTLPLPPPQL